MYKSIFVFVGIIVVLMLSLVTLTAEEIKNTEKQTICPVMGGKINKNIYTDHENYRIYFCCAGCINTFKRNPNKYMNLFERKNIQLEELSTGKEEKKEKINDVEIKLCPVMGEPINEKYFVEYKEKKYYFCCPSCIEEFEKNPEKYIK